LVEHTTENRGVPGSSPGLAIGKSLQIWRFLGAPWVVRRRGLGHERRSRGLNGCRARPQSTGNNRNLPASRSRTEQRTRPRIMVLLVRLRRLRQLGRASIRALVSVPPYFVRREGSDYRVAWKAEGSLLPIRALVPCRSTAGQRLASFSGASLRRRTARLSYPSSRIIVLAERHPDASHHTTKLHPRRDQDDAHAVPRRLWHSVSRDQPALQASERQPRAKPSTCWMGLQRHERPVRLDYQERSMTTAEQPTERLNRHPFADGTR
jgi:hypothetical protein